MKSKNLVTKISNKIIKIIEVCLMFDQSRLLLKVQLLITLIKCANEKSVCLEMCK